MSCHKVIHGDEVKFFQKQVMVCSGCCALAESADRDIEKSFAQARGIASQWLIERVLNGLLLAGGSGAEGIEVNVQKKAGT